MARELVDTPVKQHLIDPEICIRCYTCEESCPIGAISHDDNNVVVDAAKCDFCMDCISPCPTGSIDNWRVVTSAYSLEQQFQWLDLPAQEEMSATASEVDTTIEALDEAVAALLAEAHQGTGGKATAPASASKPFVNLFNLSHPAEASVQGNFRLTDEGEEMDVRHIILNFDTVNFPVLEGQSIGITPPGVDENGKPYLPRLYSVSSPRDGERPNTNNLSLTIKRESHGVCSNYVCDLKRGDTVRVTGPFGATFLLPEDPQAKLIMICTGTGSAPFRAFTMRRQRTMPDVEASMHLFFGARTPETLPYFGPLEKVPQNFLTKHFAFSRIENETKEYVQDKMRTDSATIAALLQDPHSYIYVCGLKAMESGVEDAFDDIARDAGINWNQQRTTMRQAGRYHVETY
jgi:benzoyl-CoA 2,3-epoxidase subunit A